MAAPNPPGKRDRVLSDDEVRQFWNALPTAISSPEVQQILRLSLVTGQRVGEVAGLTAKELNLRTGVWIIPGSRTKNGHPHSVPLSRLAVSLIQTLIDSRPLPDKPLVNSTVIATLVGRAQAKFGLPHFTAHDLRRSALTKLAELGVPPIVLGHIANHRTTTKAGITLGVYVQYEYEQEKRQALELWSDRLQGIVSGGADIVPIRSGR